MSELLAAGAIPKTEIKYDVAKTSEAHERGQRDKLAHEGVIERNLGTIILLVILAIVAYVIYDMIKGLGWFAAGAANTAAGLSKDLGAASSFLGSQVTGAEQAVNGALQVGQKTLNKVNNAVNGAVSYATTTAENAGKVINANAPSLLSLMEQNLPSIASQSALAQAGNQLPSIAKAAQPAILNQNLANGVSGIGADLAAHAPFLTNVAAGLSGLLGDLSSVDVSLPLLNSTTQTIAANSTGTQGNTNYTGAY